MGQMALCIRNSINLSNRYNTRTMAENKQTEDELKQQEAKPDTGKRRIDGNLLMSFAAIFLSAGTLFILIYQSNVISKQFELQQQQQFASAMPYLMLSSEFDGTNLRINVSNQGLGPAFVEAVRVHYKDTVFENSDFFNAYYYLKKMDKNISEAKSYHTIKAGLLIPSQESIQHFHLVRPEELKYDLIMEGFAQLEIEYRSIYNERWRVRGFFGIPERIE